MREIKFRGVSLFDGTFWEGYYVYSRYDDKHYITSNAKIHGNLNQFVGFAHFTEIDPKTLGQFTGLKDKNGKEIYESDTLKHYPGFGCEWTNRKSLVEYEGASFWADHTIENEDRTGIKLILDDHDQTLEVIGNIHENPELL